MRQKQLQRVLGLDGNPLRRTADRALAWIGVATAVAFLAAAPLAAVAAGTWMDHAARAEARVQAAGAHSVRAVLLQSARPLVSTVAAIHGSGQAWVPARWHDAGPRPRTGEVLAPSGLPAGSVVTVWLDASGTVTRPPLQPGQIASRVTAAAAGAPTLLALCLLTALRIVHRIAERRRIAGWGAAWSTVGPEWTGRR